jgi:hypothetical protein
VQIDLGVSPCKYRLIVFLRSSCSIWYFPLALTVKEAYQIVIKENWVIDVLSFINYYRRHTFREAKID